MQRSLTDLSSSNTAFPLIRILVRAGYADFDERVRLHVLVDVLLAVGAEPQFSSLLAKHERPALGQPERSPSTLRHNRSPPASDSTGRRPRFMVILPRLSGVLDLRIQIQQNRRFVTAVYRPSSR